MCQLRFKAIDTSSSCSTEAHKQKGNLEFEKRNSNIQDNIHTCILEDIRMESNRIGFDGVEMRYGEVQTIMHLRKKMH